MTAADLVLPDSLKGPLDAAVRAIIELAHPELIILFGSWAEGTARADSDVDLMVVAEAELGAHLGVALEDALEPLLSPRELDLLVVRAQDWPHARRVIGFVTHEADQRGVKLYERAA